MLRNLAYLLVFTTLVLSACSRKAARWDNNVAVPLFSTEMTLNDIDKRYLVNNLTDSGYTLVYDNLVYNARTLRVTATQPLPFAASNSATAALYNA
jgi:hypothetical protein